MRCRSFFSADKSSTHAPAGMNCAASVVQGSAPIRGAGGRWVMTGIDLSEKLRLTWSVMITGFLQVATGRTSHKPANHLQQRNHCAEKRSIDSRLNPPDPSLPERRTGFFQDAAKPYRRDTCRQSRRIVGLDRNRA